MQPSNKVIDGKITLKQIESDDSYIWLVSTSRSKRSSVKRKILPPNLIFRNLIVSLFLLFRLQQILHLSYNVLLMKKTFSMETKLKATNRASSFHFC